MVRMEASGQMADLVRAEGDRPVGCGRGGCGSGCGLLWPGDPVVSNRSGSPWSWWLAGLREGPQRSRFQRGNGGLWFLCLLVHPVCPGHPCDVQ